MKIVGRFLVVLVFAGISCVAGQEAAAPAAQAIFQFQEVMVPVRDGVHLQTVILTPTNMTKPLPMLFRPTPYGVPEKAPAQMPASLKKLPQHSYISLIPNLPPRFNSHAYLTISSP